MKFNLRYLPKKLSAKDRKRQAKMLNKSKKLYKKGIYFSRPSVKTFKSKKIISKITEDIHVNKFNKLFFNICVNW